MRTSWPAAVMVLLAACGGADAHDTGWFYARTYYYPVYYYPTTYAVTRVPVYYGPAVCGPVAVVVPARPAVAVPNLAVPTAAPPSQTREPPVAPGKDGKADKAPEAPQKSGRPPQVGETSFYLNPGRPAVGPPVVTGESRRDTVPVRR